MWEISEGELFAAHGRDYPSALDLSAGARSSSDDAVHAVYTPIGALALFGRPVHLHDSKGDALFISKAFYERRLHPRSSVS
jgi:hypothetical protein